MKKQDLGNMIPGRSGQLAQRPEAVQESKFETSGIRLRLQLRPTWKAEESNTPRASKNQYDRMMPLLNNLRSHCEESEGADDEAIPVIIDPMRLLRPPRRTHNDSSVV